MLFKVCSVRRISGISKKTGNSYDMPQVLRLVEIEERSTNSFTMQGAGFESVDLSVSNAFFPQLLDIFKNSIGDAPFVDLDLELGLNSQNNTIVTGFSSSQDITINPVDSDSKKSSLFNKSSVKK